MKKKRRRAPDRDYRVSVSPAARWTHWLTVPTGTFGVRVDGDGDIREVADRVLQPFVGESFAMLLRSMGRRWKGRVSWMRM